MLVNQPSLLTLNRNSENHPVIGTTSVSVWGTRLQFHLTLSSWFWWAFNTLLNTHQLLDEDLVTFTSLLGFQNDSSAWIRALALLPQIYQAQLEPDAHLWNAIIGDVSASGHWRLSFWDLAIHGGPFFWGWMVHKLNTKVITFMFLFHWRSCRMTRWKIHTDKVKKTLRPKKYMYIFPCFLLAISSGDVPLFSYIQAPWTLQVWFS